ncbi:unnamed protein product [Microthlaspi erraticum]|uniref:RNase H type-1 domain-containing protein n=1 Tax=Microthlaspi erraticum TaxID=1685480 RepID=A0A6D2IVJ3_9BRAS|nr:unnamed protein product [Microthlaspi erraticum]
MSGWSKVNTELHAGFWDGNSRWVLRDENGTWQCSFAINIRVCSAPLAELWDVYYDLYMAWKHRVQRLLVQIVHVYREANCVADGLANHAFSLPLGFHSFPSVPSKISELVMKDANGFTLAHLVRIG